MEKTIFTLTVLGLFCALASYSCGKYCHSPQYHGYSVPSVKNDAGVAFKVQVQHDCGLDWLCLVEQAEREHPRKGKKK